ncbi:MAG: thioredoxin TrxC [Desulfomicrobium sp.]|nr:thioredoxin TrxC [Desulfomicrobium sp.]
MSKFHAVCPKCWTINAVHADKIQDNPVCAKCKTSLLPTSPISLTDDSFMRFSSRSSLPLVVDFWAPWCGPCKMMGPAFASAAPLLHGRALFAKVDTQANQGLAERFHIQSIPTLVFMRQGQEKARQAGAMSLEQIRHWVEQQL